MDWEDSVTEQFVVDANVVAKLYLRDERDVQRADLLFSRFGHGAIELVAPYVIMYEVPAAIKKGVARVQASEDVWKKAMSSFESLRLTIIDDSGARLDAMRLAVEYSCGYYDALYLLLAEDLGYRFVTADERLIRGWHTRAPYMLPLASYT